MESVPPKGTDLSRHGPDDLYVVVAALDGRLRRTRGWRTLADVAASRGRTGCRGGPASWMVCEHWEILEEAVPDLTGVKRTAPKQVSLTEPSAAWSIKDGRGRFAYGLNAIIDAASGIVRDVLAAPAGRRS